MNRQGFLNVNVQGKLLLAFLLAVILPFILLLAIIYNSATQLSIQNLESFVHASGARRQSAIESDFTTALNHINNFLDSVSNEEALLTPLIIRWEQGTSTDFALENQVELLFRNQLISTNYFNSIWLLTPGRGDIGSDATAFATVTAPNQTLPFSRLLQQESESDIFRVARNLIERQTNAEGDLNIEDTQALLVTRREGGGQHIEVVNLLFGDIDGEPTLVGYLIVDLNLDRIIIDNLTSQVGDIETYAYLFMPRARETGAFVAAPDVIAANLVDITSDGADNILNIAATGVETYAVSFGDESREVIGYYSPIVIDNQTFSLVSEMPTDVIQGQLFQYIASPSFPILLGALVVAFVAAFLMTQLIVPPINQLRDATRGIIRGNFEVPILGLGRGDEIGQLSVSFVDMRAQVRNLTDDMENRLRIRTRDVRVTQDIARTVTNERDLNRLMTLVVDMVVENFPSIYHAQIFLIDEENQQAVLRASTGEAGQALLQRGHKLAVGSVSVIGQVTEQGQVIIARDTAESDVHRRNEFLQETRAELAIPMQLADTVIGAFDVQSKQRDSFDDDQVRALQTLADQITIAIENARLYDRSARILADIERDRSAATQQAWQQYLYSQRQQGLGAKSGTVTDYDFTELNRAAFTKRQPIVGDVTDRQTVPFVVPILLRGEVLGVAEYEVADADFSYDKVLLAEELVNRLAISLDNARLFQDSQQAVERERIVNEISTKLTGQTDVEDILETAIREVGLALRTSQVAIRLQSAQKNNGSSHAEPQENPS